MILSKRLIRLVVVSTIALATFNTACQSEIDEDGGWEDLFDGKTLVGWKVINQDWDNPDRKPEFYVENNMIICNTTLNTGGGYLVTEKSYDNFILELDVKIDNSLNSGIQCRSQMWEKDTITTYVSGNAEGTVSQHEWPIGYVWGYQIEIDPSDRAWSGGLYEPGNRGWVVTLSGNETARKAFKKMDWNHFKIVMNGNKIQTFLNDIKVLDTIDDLSSTGFIGLQFHGASKEIQNNKKSMWKNIRIKKL